MVPCSPRHLVREDPQPLFGLEDSIEAKPGVTGMDFVSSALTMQFQSTRTNQHPEEKAKTDLFQNMGKQTPEKLLILTKDNENP